MSLSTNRRRSSWFGPQFSMNNFSFSSIGSSISSTQRTTPIRPPVNVPKLPMPEPLFHEAYLVSEEELSPNTPDPVLHGLWKTDYDSDYFGGPEETLEDLGLVMDDDECSIVATFISITHAGKPKVVDILPISAPSSRGHSPRRNADNDTRPPVVWRMPSYEGSPSRSSQSTYEMMSDRTESLCSISTSPSSFSDECKTPESMSLDLSHLTELQNLSSAPSRTKTLRRHSRNLSASFSKAFLNRLKDSEPAPPLPTAVPVVPPMPAAFLLSNTYSQSSRGASLQKATLEPPLSKHDMFRNSPQSTLKHVPALRRKKSIAGLKF